VECHSVAFGSSNTGYDLADVQKRIYRFQRWGVWKNDLKLTSCAFGVYLLDVDASRIQLGDGSLNNLEEDRIVHHAGSGPSMPVIGKSPVLFKGVTSALEKNKLDFESEVECQPVSSSNFDHSLKQRSRTKRNR